MIPLRDDNPSLTVPVVTRVLIALNVLAFVGEIRLGPELQPFIAHWALIPERLTLALHAGQGPALGVALKAVLGASLLAAYLALALQRPRGGEEAA